MASQHSSRGRAQDRAKVAGGQQYEVRYEAREQSVSAEDVKHAAGQVGNSRRAVEEQLAGKRS